MMHNRMMRCIYAVCLCILLSQLIPSSSWAMGENGGMASLNSQPSDDFWRFSSDSRWRGLDYGTLLTSESAGIESRLIDEKISFQAELCRSRRNDGLIEENTAVQNHAWKTRLAGKGGILSWGVSTSHMSPTFLTYSHPTGVDDRSKYSFDSTIDLSPSTFCLNVLRSRDYLDNDETNPVADTSSGTIRYTYARPDVPSFLTSYTVHDLAYENSAGIGQRIRKTSHTLTVGTSLAGSRWSVSPTYSVKRLDDRSVVTDGDLDSTVVKISGRFAPDDRLSFTPLVAVTTTVPTHARVRTNTYRSSLSTTMALIPRDLSLTTTLSHLDSQAQDKSVDSTTISAGGRIDWTLDRFIHDPMNKSVSIGAHATRTRDRAGDTTENAWDMSAAVMIGFPNRVSYSSRDRIVAYR